MLKLIEELHARSSRLILGIMSGTSLDGLDLALCQVNTENTSVEVLAYETLPFPIELHERLEATIQATSIELRELTLLNRDFTRLCGHLCTEFLHQSRFGIQDVDLIGFSGHTLYHIDDDGLGKAATFQLGDGCILAKQLQKPVISDFRQAHIGAGGKGAPLVPYVDALLFGHPQKNRLLLNIGGVANGTWLAATQSKKAVLATDTGPGNTLLDLVSKRHFSEPYDRGGAHAKMGMVQEKLLDQLKSHPFFRRVIPRSTGREEFNWAWLRSLDLNETYSPEDWLATLGRFTVWGIKTAFESKKCEEVYVGGGGAHNGYLMDELGRAFPRAHLMPFDELGLSIDAREAVSFAVLANAWFLDETRVPLGLLRTRLGKLSLP